MLIAGVAISSLHTKNKLFLHSAQVALLRNVAI